MSDQHHDSDVVFLKILLVPKILICSDENIESAAGQFKQITVVLRLPTLITHCRHFMPFEVVPQAARN